MNENMLRPVFLSFFLYRLIILISFFLSSFFLSSLAVHAEAGDLLISGSSDEDLLNEMLYFEQEKPSDKEEDLKNTVKNDTKPGFAIRGHYKNIMAWSGSDSFLNNADSLPEKRKMFASLNRVRISPELKYGQNLFIHADIDNQVILSDYAHTRTFDLYWYPSNYNDLCDPSFESKISEDAEYRFNIHRLYAKLVSGDFTMTIGRQQIRYGSGRLWNPLDLLNPISPTFIEGAEDQKGTDAVRVEYYPGSSSEISIVYAPHRKNDKMDSRIFANRNTNLVGRYKTTVNDMEMAVLGGRVAGKDIAGIDIAGIINKGMLRGSLVFASPDDGDHYFMASAGYEYNFQNGIYCMVEYFFNENAFNDKPELKEAYMGVISGRMTDKTYRTVSNTFLTFNSHYTGIALGYDITPLMRAELFLMADFEGQGIFYSPALKYNLLQNLDLTFSAMLGHVRNQEGTPSDFASFEDHPLFSGTIQWYF
ncbi:hypothetical protein QUF76_02455 [Desulfobacterales bacterium HSG16]|nr:hypothetical protein [Desulfobacterales bacterium HSG16]